MYVSGRKPPELRVLEILSQDFDNHGFFGYKASFAPFKTISYSAITRFGPPAR